MKQLLKICAIVALLLGVATHVSPLAAKEQKREVQQSKSKPQPKSKYETITLLTNIDCPKCEAKIMKVLPYQKGIKEVKVDIKKHTVMVKFDPAKSSERAITESLRKLDVEVKKPR